MAIPKSGDELQEDKNLGSVGGRAANATSGAFVQGLVYAAAGNHRGGIGTQKDLRGGDACPGAFCAGPTIKGDGNFTSKTSNIQTGVEIRGGTPASSGVFSTGATVLAKAK